MSERPPGEPTPINAKAETIKATLPSLKMAKRLVTIEVPEYEGMSFVAWVNYGPEVREAFRRNDEESRIDALKQIVVSTNFKDDDGKPYLKPDTDDFWKAIPDDLAVIMISQIVDNVGKLPTKNAGR